MFQETTSTTTKGSPESEREKEGKDMQSPILKLPSIGTILKEKEQFSTESERTKTFTLQQDKSRVHSEYQPSWKASSSIQPLPEQAELKTTEKSSQEYELFPHFLSEDVVRGFQMPPLKSTTIYSERCVRPTASAKQLVKDFSGTRKTLEAGEYSVTSKTTELKEEVAERRTGGYAGLGVTGSSGYSESSKKLFIGSSTVGELSKIPRLQISSILEERKPTGKTVSVSSSDWKEIGEGSFDSHSVEEPIASIDPRSMLASSSTSKLSSQVLSEKDKHALRLMRNRLSAERSRNRKRQRMQTLEQEVREKEETIGLLREDMNALLRYVERLEAFCKVLDVPSSELTRPELNYKP
ncbi:uncharacterized protein Gasu_39020 [Galdieria sulphuraria]|uniref:BZIP domain-containing protein n=1 Tax=Galdieria sulphuraria TaxID=130081 RepID=M2WXD2_GALSU|nr:uncharacterized protein Gasu_39020 [Galdieria sulphuraria]EME28695.1 hypothetical protein Gasu_39020 [Galdieria sulphuraria]|eukprot:XP_005705215.1 hypothetical protein Gasu_39020 [Galdieria sulphuraria]